MLIAVMTIGAVTGYAQPPIRVEIMDHTPPPSADEAELPEALRGMYLPRGALDGLTEVYSSPDGPVRSVQIAWLSGDRYLWRVELAEPLADGQTMTVYLDADANPNTGRADARGADIMLQMSPDGNRSYEWMADGNSINARQVRSALDGAVVWFSYDHALASAAGGAHCTFWITLPATRTDPIQALIPRLIPQPPSEGTLAVERHTRAIGDGVTVTTVELTNPGDCDRWIDLQFPVPLAFKDEFHWFDGFNFTPHVIGTAPISYHGTSAVLPVTCAWDETHGIALAFHPLNWYTELHNAIRPTDEGLELVIGTRLAIAPGETERFETFAFSFDGGLGWRGAFDVYWKMFPEVYDRARDIDPRFHMASAGGLYRSWTDPADEAFAMDLVRRMHGHWEWGYAPAPRPGEWAVSELSVGEWTRSRGTVKKSLSAESLPEVRRRIRKWVHDTAELADVAVAYYMHLKNVEKGLMERYWPDSYFRNQPIEYHGYYQQVPCWFAYPWADSYGEYLRRAIPSIVRDFEPAGIAFDSVFGFIPHWGPSADRSPGTTFDNGLAFVGEGIGFAQQMDVVRRQHTGSYRTAMVTNLKLPTLSADAVRTDCALLEFHPMNNPSYRERILRLRMLSGRIMFNWWHTYNPAYFKWIPWDELNTQQTIDAFRRLRDDLLIHSLYYGGVPNARFAVGVPKLMRAIPMLIEIADLGWQPVIGAQVQGGELLVSRFGDGLGMVFGIGNQSYERQEGWLVLNQQLVVNGRQYLFAAYGDRPTRTDLYPQTPNVSVSVAPRDIMALRAVVSLPGDRRLQAVVTGVNALPAEPWRRYLPGSWTINLNGVRPASETEIAVWLPEHAVEPTVTLNGRPLTCSRSGQQLRLTARLKEETNELVVSWHPRVALQGNQQALLNYPFVAEGRPNCNIIAAGGTSELAFRIQEYFREYYRWATNEAQTVKLPIVTPEQAPAGRRVVVGLLDDLPADLQIDLGSAEAAFGAHGEIIYATARTPQMLERAVEGLLFTLDERYEYSGPFYPTQYFFEGDPTKSPSALQETGIAGRVLTGDDTGSLREIIDLPDLIEWP